MCQHEKVDESPRIHKITYSLNDRIFARKVLGLRTDKNDLVKIVDRDKEALLVTIELLKNQIDDKKTSGEGAIRALTDKMVILRKAKKLANSRADKAVASMKKMLEEFQESLMKD
tara:strand:- start:4042 stop:4386 length:345 start_codon:yes stop_codon:yes gene_type:complete